MAGLADARAVTAPGGARAVARCNALGVAPYSDMVGGLYRGYLTPAYQAAQAALSEWERGVKRPGGPALRLLSIVSRKGLEAIV